MHLRLEFDLLSAISHSNHRDLIEQAHIDNVIHTTLVVTAELHERRH